MLAHTARALLLGCLVLGLLGYGNCKVSTTRTRNATLIQQGHVVFNPPSTVPASWSEGSTQARYDWPAYRIQGLRYQIHTSMRLDKPCITALTLTLNVTPRGPARTVGQVAVIIEDVATSATYSNANLPQWPLAPPTGWLTIAADDGTGWDTPVPPAVITLHLGTAITDPVNGTTLYDLAGFGRPLESAYGGGIINLSVLIDTNSIDTQGVNVTPTLTITDLGFFTGIDNHDMSWGRPVRDMKTGLPTHVPELVEDGYQPGIWTTKAQYDPADPRDERSTPLPSDEGTWDDDVPAT